MLGQLPPIVKGCKLASAAARMTCAGMAGAAFSHLAHAGRDQLAGPEGLAVAPDGGLGRGSTPAPVSRIHLGTGAVTPLVEGLALETPGPPNLPPIWTFDLSVVGPSRAINVSAHGIHRFEMHP